MDVLAQVCSFRGNQWYLQFFYVIEYFLSHLMKNVMFDFFSETVSVFDMMSVYDMEVSRSWSNSDLFFCYRLCKSWWIISSFLVKHAFFDFFERVTQYVLIFYTDAPRGDLAWEVFCSWHNMWMSDFEVYVLFVFCLLLKHCWESQLLHRGNCFQLHVVVYLSHCLVTEEWKSSICQECFLEIWIKLFSQNNEGVINLKSFF